MRTTLKIIIVILLIISCGVICVVLMPKANILESDVEAEIEAIDLYRAFQANEAEAGEKYIGKVLIIKGRVVDHFKDENAAPVLILGENPDNSAVLLSLEASQKDYTQKLIPGDMVKAKALCSGMLMEVVLNKGILLK